MAKKVLVTGAYGFLGRHTAAHYSGQGWNVIGVGHGQWAQEEWSRWGLSEWHHGSVSIDSLREIGTQPNVIVHCAGSGSVSYSIEQPLVDFKKNVDSTLQILEFIRSYSSNTRLVLPSSAAVYGKVNEVPIRTDSPLRPVSPYGVNKKIAEELCQTYATYYGTEISIIRLFSVGGRGLTKQLLWDASRKVKENNYEFFGTGNEVRDWIHVEDAASLLYQAHERASRHVPIVNAGSGNGVSVRQILSRLFQCYGLVQSPSFSGDARKGDPDSYVADVSQALSWGWKPEKTWEDMVDEYSEWFKGACP
jgi:UDP-glucose 4-epimerase